MDKKTSEKIKKEAENLLKELKIKAKIKSIESDDEAVNLNIETEESGVLIGYHGETLSSFQLMVSLIAYKKLGVWTRVVVEVGDYRARREEQLAQMAKSFAERVKASGKEVVLPYLTAGERRYIHLALQDDPDVTSESEGEGPSRRLVVRLKIK